MNYHEAMEYLQNLTKFGMNFGLGRITELLRRMDDPHQKLRVIHVGGTNGKGSTTAMLSSILARAGYKVGTFTSPHLHSYTERYRINGEEITKERVAEIIERLRPHLDSMVAEGFEHPTEFEVSTAAGFLYFYEEKVDFLVLEVGLGGAIDSTNVVNPILSVITNVAMDHMDYLGHTITEIAGIKAGIIKQNVPVVTAAGHEDALRVIRQVCREKKSPLVLVGTDISWRFEGNEPFPAGQRFTVYGRLKEYKDLQITLLGRHQLQNAAIAVAVVELLTEQGVKVSEEALKQGLADTRWPARFEIISGKPTVVIDGAHNYDGARSLRNALEEYFPGRPMVLVLGMLGDKERGKVVAELAPGTRAVVVTRPNSPRAGDWQLLAAEAQKHTREIHLIEQIPDAVRMGLELAEQDGVVCITGSLYMVAEAREVLLGIKS